MDEKAYLKKVLSKINLALEEINNLLNSQQENIREAQRHMQEHKRDMDHLEKNNVRESVDNMMLVGDNQLARRKQLYRLSSMPYFGRFDFTPKNGSKTMPIYIGVHNFQDQKKNKNIIYDWRAPISSIFYDFEYGDAWYENIDKKIHGTVSLKRQYRIRKGEMEYMIESDVAIQDEVLQKELNQASTDKMRNIVATIQREQNAIIRNEHAQNIIIQGVAGSGKTSIALHRIAFLLYKFKETISSDDILIISPNKVFASYISNVLPELGEETVAETNMEDLANQLLEHEFKFQSFFDQVAELLEKPEQKFIDRIQFKSSGVLLKKMDDYFLHLENNAFKPEDIFINGLPVPSWFIEEKFKQYSRLPLLKRFNEIVREVVNNVFIHYKYQVEGKERTELHKTIRKMFPSTNLRMLYKGFYEWLKAPELLKLKKGSVYEFADVYPLIYLKMKLEGLTPFHKVKHLVVDEMQDYSAVQYKIINQLFQCKKTVLGDINQSVNPFSSSDLATIKSIIPNAETMTLLKSYRSTFEITMFTKKISAKFNVEAIERHGSEPAIERFKSRQEELQRIDELITTFDKSGLNSLGIISKTQKQAEALSDALKARHKVQLLDAGSVAFGGGVVITTAHLAKGLEFDHVIVPFCTQENYATEPDRQMLYVACTRAMHQLTVTHSGQPSQMIKF